MDIRYGPRSILCDGTILSSEQCSRPPSITFFTMKPDRNYTFLLFDPDAVHGNKIHWLIVNHSVNNTGDCIFPYVGPNPPKRTGYHCYHFVLIRQDQKIDPIPFLDRRHMELSELFRKLGFTFFDVLHQTCFYTRAQ
ncbi:hypothetical protein EBZ80_05285 [bacterium]|nr:hypothetical protein [bacterium]